MKFPRQLFCCWCVVGGPEYNGARWHYTYKVDIPAGNQTHCGKILDHATVLCALPWRSDSSRLTPDTRDEDKICNVCYYLYFTLKELPEFGKDVMR